MSRHNGRVAIVSGAGAGIGRATAQVMIENGVSVVAVGRTRETLEELVDELGADKVAVHVADVTADDAPAASVALALERFGRLDYLVNNAGKGKPFPVHESTDEIFDDYLNVLLRAPFRYCREALKVMKAGSAIVNVSSTYSIVGGLRGGAYSAAKAGLNGLTLHMAAQYGAQGIRSNSVAPGVTETPMTRYNWETEAFKRMNFEMTPMNRTCTAQDIAEAIWFLLSDMGSFINGQVLAVDGGWTTTKYLSEEARLAERVKL